MKHTLHIFFIVLVLSIFATSTKAETAIKLNAVYACGGVLNPAVEIAVHRNFTVQLEGLTSFYQSLTLGKKIKNMPLLLWKPMCFCKSQSKKKWHIFYFLSQCK